MLFLWKSINIDFENKLVNNRVKGQMYIQLMKDKFWNKLIKINEGF